MLSTFAYRLFSYWLPLPFGLLGMALVGILRASGGNLPNVESADFTIIPAPGYEGGNLQASYGAYQDGGGKTDDVNGNIGFQPYEGSFLNLTGEFRNHGHTVRSAPLDYTINPTPTPGLYPAAGLKPIDINALNAPGWPVLNLIQGDSKYDLKVASFNSGLA